MMNNYLENKHIKNDEFNQYDSMFKRLRENEIRAKEKKKKKNRMKNKKKG